MKLRKCICVVEKWGKFQVPPVSSVVAAARDERSWVEGEPAKGAAGPELCASGQTLHPRACVWLYLDALLQRYRPRESRVGRIPINQPAAFSSESVFRDRYPWWCSGTVTCSPLRTASCSGGQAPCARGKQRESPGPEERPPSLPVQRSNGGGKHRGHCRAGRPMAAAGGFSCPRCSMVFGSGPLLRAHQEKLCLGTPAGSSSRGPGGDPLPVEGAPGTVRRPRHSWVVWSGVWCGVCGAGTGMGAGLGCAWVRKRGHSHHGWIQPDLSWGDPPSSPLHCVGDSQCLFWQSQESFCYLAFFHPFLPIGLPEFGVSQHRDRAEPHRLLILPGLPPAARGQRGPERVRGAPLGDVLTPRERVLLRMADPSARKPTLEQGEHPRPPAPARGHQQPLQELLETHQRHVAEIRARTQQLEQQREGPPSTSTPSCRPPGPSPPRPGRCDCPTCVPEDATRPSCSSSSTSRWRPRRWRKEPRGCAGAGGRVSGAPWHWGTGPGCGAAGHGAGEPAAGRRAPGAEGQEEEES
ncbi:coiled-coil domain-containing protein 17 isoform X11 [Columba livia]|uniref:coiled-coil domain-containing protein 17 isoform X11 n=1 Tax=Columba livia TaxID=8932 RepID=UPI0031BB6FE2